MTQLIRALTIMLLGIGLISCSAIGRANPGSGSSAAASPAASPRPTTAGRVIPDPGPQIDWDHPFQGEGLTNVDPSALVLSPTQFGTSIRPVQPQPSTGKLRWVDVSADGTVAYVFDFAADPAFPSDGRVLIEESAATMTQDEYIGGGWPGTDNTFATVGPITVLVRSFEGRADGSFIYHGILFDIKGADLGPIPAMAIAKQLASQATS